MFEQCISAVDVEPSYAIFWFQNNAKHCKFQMQVSMQVSFASFNGSFKTLQFWYRSFHINTSLIVLIFSRFLSAVKTRATPRRGRASWDKSAEDIRYLCAKFYNECITRKLLILRSKVVMEYNMMPFDGKYQPQLTLYHAYLL